MWLITEGNRYIAQKSKLANYEAVKTSWGGRKSTHLFWIWIQLCDFFFRFFFFAFVTMVVTSNRSLSNHLLTQVPVTHTHQPWHSLISTPLSLWTIDATSLTDPHTSPLFTFTYSVFLLMTFSISLRVTNSDSRRVTSSVSYKYKRLKTIQTVQLSRCCLASLLSCLPSITLM